MLYGYLILLVHVCVCMCVGGWGADIEDVQQAQLYVSFLSLTSGCVAHSLKTSQKQKQLRIALQVNITSILCNTLALDSVF